MWWASTRPFTSDPRLYGWILHVENDRNRPIAIRSRTLLKYHKNSFLVIVFEPFVFMHLERALGGGTEEGMYPYTTLATNEYYSSFPGPSAVERT